MPLEIKELQIRVTVNEQKAREAASAAPNGQIAKEARNEIVQQIMDGVLDVLNSKKER